MGDRRHDHCPYDASRNVQMKSGSVYGPYCVGHAEDFVRKVGGEILLPARVAVRPVACRADWLNAAEIP